MRIGTGRAGRLVVLAAMAAIVVAACGGGVTPSPAATQASGAPTSSPAPSEGIDEYQVAVATDATAGPYLTGKGGLALYVFTNDTGPTSTCYDACATAWPPLLAEAGGTVSAAPTIGGTFATTNRTDGTMQVTYNGAPLYYFQGDAKPGDVNGQGLNGVWFLAAP